MNPKGKIIVALDGLSLSEAFSLAEKLRDRVWGFKVEELLDRCGMQVVRDLAVYGGVFADPKIYTTPRKAACRVSEYIYGGADFVTVHASGGVAMMQETVKATRRTRTKILAVIELSTTKERDEFHAYESLLNSVSRCRVLGALDAGVHGIICSPDIFDFLRYDPRFDELSRVAVGVRPRWAQKDDHRKTITPAEAVRAGADYLVIGRPIINPPPEIGTSLDAVKRITEEIVF